MSKKDKIPKELRIERKKTSKKLYDKPINPTRFGRKKSILGPLITFVVLSTILIIFFKGQLEVAIVVISFLFLAILAGWFFSK